MSAFSQPVRLDRNTAVKQFRYRSATVRDRIISIPRDQFRETEELLAKAASAQIDNHTVYEITSPDGNAIYVLCSDHRVHFGFILEERGR